MIFIDRASVPIPTVLTGNFKKTAIKRARVFYRRAIQYRRQYRFGFDSKIWKSIRPDLMRLFNSKCAYCESPLVTDLGSIDHFRPHSGAMGFGKDFWPDHYWWLAYDWSNMLLACNVCKVSKGKKFPILGKRAQILAKGSSLKREKPLLLDPCDLSDNPDDHLLFLHSGEIQPKSKRGEATIAVLTLNRKSLIQARAQAADEILEQWNIVKHNSRLRRALQQRILDAKQPYLALKHAIFRKLTSDSKWYGNTEAEFMGKASFVRNLDLSET